MAQSSHCELQIFMNIQRNLRIENSISHSRNSSREMWNNTFLIWVYEFLIKLSGYECIVHYVRTVVTKKAFAICGEKNNNIMSLERKTPLCH